MPTTSTRKILAGIVAALIALVGAIIFLSRAGIISFAMAILMLVALFGMCVGFGILIVAYRLMGRLE